MAVQSKPYYVDFDGLTSSAETDARISQYVDIVRQAEQVISGPHDIQATRDVARHWSALAGLGKLQPLPLQSWDDSIYTGVKGQILGCAKDLVKELTVAASHEQKAGNPRAAAADLILALETLQSLRYSDVTSVTVVGNQQKRLLGQLAEVATALPPSQKAVVRAKVAEFRPSKSEFERVLHTERRYEVVEDARVHDVAVAKGESPNKSINVVADLSLLTQVASDTEAAVGRAVKEVEED